MKNVTANTPVPDPDTIVAKHFPWHADPPPVAEDGHPVIVVLIAGAPGVPPACSGPVIARCWPEWLTTTVDNSPIPYASVTRWAELPE